MTVPASESNKLDETSRANPTEAPVVEPDSLIGTLSNLGPVAQAALPGLYAWGVTVSPLAWARGGPLLAKLAALAGVAALVAAPFAERRAPGLARIVSVWGFALASAIVWLVVPPSSARIETARALAGVVGWALFAFASAAPAPSRDPSAAGRVVASAPLRPRGRIAAGDRVILTAGIAAAAAFQAMGWSATVTERALLVRLVAVAAGLAVIGGATRVALSRHAQLTVPPRRRLRAAAPHLAALAALLVAGLAVRLAR